MLEENHVIPLVLLSIAALFLNLCLIFSIKSRRASLNVIDILQIANTFLVLLGVLTLTTFSLLDCFSLGSHKTIVICYFIDEILQYVFLHSICWAFLAIAVVRRKVCECRGRASVLVTKVYAIRTCIICAIPIIIMILILLSLINEMLATKLQHHDGTNTSSTVLYMYTESVFGSQYQKFALCQILLINLFPLALGCFFYFRILYVVNQAAQSMERAHKRNRNPSRVITASVIVLLTTTIIIWLLFIVCSVVALAGNISKHLFMYLKTAIFILYPIADGLFIGSRRSKVSHTTSTPMERSRARISPVLEEPSDMDDFTHPALEGVMRLTVSEREDESSSSISESTGSFNAFPFYATPVANFNTEPYPSTSSDYTNDIIRTERQNRNSMENIEEEEIELDTRRALAAFSRRGSGFEIYRSRLGERKMRHISEKMRSHMFVKKFSDTPVLGNEKRLSLQPLLSPLETKERIFEQLSESPELRRLSSSPLLTSTITTKEGYTGLQYAKHLQNGENELPNHKVVSEQDKRKAFAKKRWSQVLPLMKDRSSSPQDRNDTAQFGRERNTTRPRTRKKSLIRQKSTHSFLGQFSPLPQVETISNSETGSPVIRTRSISCVNNVYMDAHRLRDMKANATKTRNKSVSFMSSFHIDENERRVRDIVDLDSEINFKIGKQRQRGERTLEKSSSFDFTDIFKRKTSHWLLDKSTSKKECMLKLQEMNEYF